MRITTVLLIVGISLVTQSCRIEMPSWIEIIGRYRPNAAGNPSAYDFKKSQALKVQTGFKDTLVIGDDPEYWHGKVMRNIITGTSIPEKKIVFFEEFNRAGQNYNIGLQMFASDEWKWLHEATKVVHIPLLTPLRSKENAAIIADTEVLFVLGAGNVLETFDYDRDMYNVRHTRWNQPDDPERDKVSKDSYGYILDAYNTGKVIAATSAGVTREGTIEPHERVVQCGDIKENCFTVVPAQYTSSASARLAAMTFYLAQFWETPEEIVEVLKECVIDVGEPGVDREYGQGIANLLCPKVLKKEIEVVSSYLEETEKGEVTEGGDLEGIWRAENSVLQVYLPTALKETTQAEYQGTLNGIVEFNGNTVTADFTAEASIGVTFLLEIQATAEKQVQTEEAYVVEDTFLTLEEETYTYTATRDSLHLIQSYTLHEALVLLPEPFRGMVDMTAEDVFEDDPIQIRMSFAKVQRLLGDFNEDDIVDFADFLLFAEAFRTSATDPNFNKVMDLVPDGMINFADFLVFVQIFNEASNT